LVCLSFLIDIAKVHSSPNVIRFLIIYKATIYNLGQASMNDTKV
jgi:hypothetical protein